MKPVKRVTAAVLLTACMLLAGCRADVAQTTTASEGSAKTSDLSQSGYDLDFTANDLDMGYDESAASKITLSDGGIQVSGQGASAAGSQLTISAAGTYVLSGSLSDGQIVVEAAQTDKVQLVLDNASLTCSSSAALYVKQADKVFVTLAAGSVNTLADIGIAYTQTDSDTAVDGVIFSKADLTVNGQGALRINAGYAHGIVSKDDLVITGGTLAVTAAGQGLSGKDCVKIGGGTFTLKTGKDAIQSDNAEDTGRGFVYIKDGVFTVDTQGDGIQAQTLLQIDGGSFQIITGGGSANASTDTQGNSNPAWGQWGSSQSTAAEDTASAKGLKAGSQLAVNGGSFQLDASDDAIHCNGDVTIAGGDITASSGDDGIHADNALAISSGVITLLKSYEGLEGKTVTISGGTIAVTASDDGVNSAGGSDTSAPGRPGQNTFSSGNSESFLKITGGELSVNAGGDGLDSNGDLYVEGGIVYVDGPTNSGNGALDYDGTGTVNGGTVAAVGSSGMAMGFSAQSEQCSLLYNLSSSYSGVPVTVTDTNGAVLVSWTPSKQFSSILVSSPDLVQNQTYTLTVGSFSAQVTLSSAATSAGTQGMGGAGGQKGGF